MKKYLFILLCLISIKASAQIQLGGYISTIGPSDTYPTHLDSLGMGGYVTTYNYTTRNAIPAARRKIGMMVRYSSNPDSTFVLYGGIANSNWTPQFTPGNYFHLGAPNQNISQTPTFVNGLNSLGNVNINANILTATNGTIQSQVGPTGIEVSNSTQITAISPNAFQVFGSSGLDYTSLIDAGLVFGKAIVGQSLRWNSSGSGGDFYLPAHASGFGISSTSTLATLSDVNGKSDTVPNVVYLSTAGIISDADISTGSRSLGTDQTAAIQAILNRASTGKPLIVYWYVRVGVKSLTLYGNTKIISAPGYGAILRDSTNAPMFRNAHKVASGTIIDSNIVFHGGIWNFNRLYQAHDTPTEGFVNGIKMVGVKNLTMDDNIQLLNARCFSLLCSNFYNVHINNFTVDVGSNSSINSDGLHFNGTGMDAWITNGTIRSYDDGIAFNADDVLSSYESGGFSPGPITNVYIKNIILNSSLFGIRLLSGADRIDNVNIDGLFGITKGYAIIADNYWQLNRTVTNAGFGNFGTININNINVNVTAKGVSFAIKSSYMNFLGNFDNINISNVNRRYFSYTGAPIFRADSAFTHISNFRLSNITSIDTSGISTDPLMSINSGATIDNMIMNSIYATKTTDLDAPLIAVNAGVVNNVKSNDITTEHLLSAIDANSGTVGNVQGSDIIYTNNSTTKGWLNTSITITSLDLKGCQNCIISSGTGSIINNTYNDGTPYSYFTQSRNKLGSWSNSRNEFANNLSWLDYTPTSNDGSNQTFANEMIINAFGSSTKSRIGGVSIGTYNYGSGNITNANGGTAGVYNLGSGTITNGYAYTLLTPIATGPITTAGGLLIQAQKVTGVSSAIAVNQQGANDTWLIAGPISSTNAIATTGNLSTTTGNLSAGITTALTKFHIVNNTSLATTLNAANRTSIISAQSGTSASVMQDNTWIVRNTASGTNWTTATWFDGISVDNSFVTPYTDTKTWYARNPQIATHTWGDGANTFMTLNSSGLTIPIPNGAINDSLLSVLSGHIRKISPTYYAPLASPAFTGTPTAPTATSGTNTTQLATTAFTQSAFTTFLGSANTWSATNKFAGFNLLNVSSVSAAAGYGAIGALSTGGFTFLPTASGSSITINNTGSQASTFTINSTQTGGDNITFPDMPNPIVAYSIHGNSTTTGSATTSVTVTIGQTMPNSNYYVSISPQDLVTAVNWYISAKTTTTFTVTFISGLTGSINFDWNITN